MDQGFCASVRAPGRSARTAPGFTLVEMMVVIVLAAILAALALPSFNGLIERYRVERMASALAAGLTHARAEAARRGQTVTVRQRAGCSDEDWSCGWDTVVGSGATEEALKRQDPDSRVVVTKNGGGTVSFGAMSHANGVASFRFQPSGSPDESSTGNVTLCMALGGRIELRKERSLCQ